MRELERNLSSASARIKVAIVGAGRLGRALAAALPDAGYEVEGPLGRGDVPHDADVVLLCVPDQEIAAAAAAIPVQAPRSLVGHCSGATGLEALAPHEAFSLHPLMTVTAESAGADSVASSAGAERRARGARFTGAGAAVAGTTARSLAMARELAAALGMQAVEIAERDRVAYHAAASMASNFLVTLEAAAEQIAATAGVDRALLVPLVRATVENWAAQGPERALTGPVARGDEATVDRQRAEVATRAPDLLELFDALADATRALAHGPHRDLEEATR
jgi:predicted short-subunit dehydrogenase-like oxidoreductase (DUF2520 family)